MTPRTRVIAALEHREPDRVPIDCGATMCSSLTGGASRNLKKHLHIEEAEDKVTCVLNDSVALSEKVLALFEIDFRTVRMKGPDSPAKGREVQGQGKPYGNGPFGERAWRA